MSKRVLTEEFGVKAIIALQAVGGIEEPEEHARAEWQKFSISSKQTTERAHEMVCGGFDDSEHEDISK